MLFCRKVIQLNIIFFQTLSFQVEMTSYSFDDKTLGWICSESYDTCKIHVHARYMRKKVTILGRIKSHRKKKSQKRIMPFLNFWLGINIFILIITIFITLCFVWFDVLAFLCPT